MKSISYILNVNSKFLFQFVQMDLLKMTLVIFGDNKAVSTNSFRCVTLNASPFYVKIRIFRLYSKSKASCPLRGIRSDLFSAQNNVIGFWWYWVTRGFPELAAITRGNFRPVKPGNFQLVLILELVLCIRSFQNLNISLFCLTTGSVPGGARFLSCFLRN